MYALDTSKIEICSITCIRGLYFAWTEIYAQFFIISYVSLQHLTNVVNKRKNNLSPKYQAKIVVIFSQLDSFNFNYC